MKIFFLFIGTLLLLIGGFYALYLPFAGFSDNPDQYRTFTFLFLIFGIIFIILALMRTRIPQKPANPFLLFSVGTFLLALSVWGVHILSMIVGFEFVNFYQKLLIMGGILILIFGILNLFSKK